MEFENYTKFLAKQPSATQVMEIPHILNTAHFKIAE